MAAYISYSHWGEKWHNIKTQRVWPDFLHDFTSNITENDSVIATRDGWMMERIKRDGLMVFTDTLQNVSVIWTWSLRFCMWPITLCAKPEPILHLIHLPLPRPCSFPDTCGPLTTWHYHISAVLVRNNWWCTQTEMCLPCGKVTYY